MENGQRSNPCHQKRPIECGSIGAPVLAYAQITYSRFFYDSNLFLVINKLNQLKHNFYWTIIIYCTIRYILILNTSPFDMGKKMVHVKLGITISQPLFSADVPLCFWHSLLLISHKIPSCSLICHHIPWYPMNLSHTIPYYSRISHCTAMKSPCFGPHPSPSPSAAAIGSRSSVLCPPPQTGKVVEPEIFSKEKT